MNMSKLLIEKREEILRIAARHGAYNVRVFGSMARGDAGPASDGTEDAHVIRPMT